ncbi:hypothetical protein KI688_005375 [Linnemannia hyalina]|uniref:Uncharacterized protein n=1 Tax=Linnemannia hyalina TaxID=64524 RepID=A0A9P7XJE3_9FUNG|nr:hypothetical protein KI688_005375 [Linnemannia hyalina]
MLSEVVKSKKGMLAPTLTLASITCNSPTSGTTVNPGNSLTFQWGDSGSFPKSGDVYSADATISCSGGSGSQIAKLEGISNGQSWTVPGNVLDTCGGDGGLEVKLSGSNYDMLHLTHWYSFEAQCGRVEVQPLPVATTTTTTAATTTTTTTTTTSAASVITATTKSATTPMPTLSTAAPTISVTPSVNGTIPGVLPPIAPGANPEVTGLNPNDPSSPSSTSSTSSDSSDSSSRSGDSSTKSGDPPSKSGGPSKAALGALGAIGGLAAIAVLIFGFVLFKRRQRHRAREERWMDHNYSSASMSDHKGPGSFNGGGNGYAFSSPGVGATTSSVSNPHLHSTEYVIPQPAPPADQNDDDNNDKQPEMSAVPARPARTYQGDFDDPTTPWDGQLGYLQPFPSSSSSSSQQASSIIIGAGAGADENMDLGYEYIQDYIPSNPTYQHDNDTNNNNRQLSMRASSQLPEDLDYFARLREASWSMPPIPPNTSSPPTPTTVDGLDCDIRTTAIQQPHSDAVPDPSS